MNFASFRMVAVGATLAVAAGTVLAQDMTGAAAVAEGGRSGGKSGGRLGG